MRKRLVASTLLVLQLAAQPAFAWDEIGHQVIARIAREGMTPRAGAAAVALLSIAWEDSDLRDMLSASGPVAERDRTCFVEASTWPDEWSRATQTSARRST